MRITYVTALLSLGLAGLVAAARLPGVRGGSEPHPQASTRRHPPGTSPGMAQAARRQDPAMARVVQVDDFGATGDGQTDDSPAVQRAVAAACAEPGPAVLRFSAGKAYRFLSPTPGPGETAGKPGLSVISLEHVADLTIDGAGARVLLHPQVQFLYAGDCRNLTVRGFEVDVAPQPFVPGRVVAVDREQHFVDVALLPGFDLPAADGTPQPEHPPFFGWILPEGQQGNAGHYFVERLTEAEPDSLKRRVVRLHARPKTFARFDGEGIVVGSRISVPVPGAAHLDRRFMQVNGCHDVTVADLEIWTLPYFAFNFGDNTGTILVQNVTLTPQPGTERLTSAGRDGFHCKGNRGQMIFDHCTLAGLRDDAFNISSMTAVLDRRVADTEVLVRRTWWPTLGCADFAAGDLVAFYDPGSRTVFHSARTELAEPEEEDTAGRDRPTPKRTRLRFADPLPELPEQTLVYNLDIPSPGTIIRGCNITGSCRMRAPLLLEDSTFTGFNWYYADEIEGPFPRQVMIRNCHFINGDPRNNRGDSLMFASPRFAPGTHDSEYGADDIVLEHNVFDGAVVFQNCRRLAVVGNAFNVTRRFIVAGLEDALFRDNTFGGEALDDLPGGANQSGAAVRVVGSTADRPAVSLMKPFAFFLGRLGDEDRNRHLAAVQHGARAWYAGPVARFGRTVECYRLTPPFRSPSGGEISLEEEVEPRFRRLSFVAAPAEDGTEAAACVVYGCLPSSVERKVLFSGELAPGRWTEVTADLGEAEAGFAGRRRIDIAFPVQPGGQGVAVLVGALSAD